MFGTKRHRPEEERQVTLEQRFRDANERAKRTTWVTLFTVKLRGVDFKALREIRRHGGADGDTEQAD